MLLKKWTFLITALIVGFLFAAFQFNSNSFTKFDNKKSTIPESLGEVLILLGNEKPLHYLNNYDLDSARMGEEMVKYGKLKDGTNTRISKYFVCTDCHNLKLETDNPADESPEKVLAFSKKNDIPFLPASTFYGMYNKEHWYNGDYAAKYGDLVAPTRDTLENAIQLCAVQCSQGRALERWEIRSILHYYKSIELKISDLAFTEAEFKEFSRLLASNKSDALAMIRKMYNPINDATFGKTEIPELENYKPQVENGEFIYKSGCMHCHAPGKEITNFDLGDDKLSYKFLNKNKFDHGNFGVPYITRKGTYAISGRKQYMPQYTLQNMSQEQMLDLLEYIKVKAEE